MRFAPVINALALPPDARVDQRVPKKLLLEQGAPTVTDKRHIQDGIEEIVWIAALKPTNIGVPAFQDETREYLEVAVLSANLRPQAKATRLIELIHRAIPYPLVLLTAHNGTVSLSLAHKRASQAEGGRVVLDGPVLVATLAPQSCALESAFLGSLRVADQPARDLFTLYQGWIDRVLALAAARLTGRFVPAADAAIARKDALDEHVRIQREIAGLRAQAGKEKQLNRRVDLDLAIQRLEAQLATVSEQL